MTGTVVRVNALIAGPMPPMEQMLGNIMNLLGYPRPLTWDNTLADAPLHFRGYVDHTTAAMRLMSPLEFRHVIAGFNKHPLVRLRLDYDTAPRLVQEKHNLWPDVMSPMQLNLIERFCSEVRLELRTIFGENVSIVSEMGTRWEDVRSV